MSWPPLIGTRRQQETAGGDSGWQELFPESSLAKCLVREGPWVTPGAKCMDEQESKGGEIRGSAGKAKWQLNG